MAFRSEMTTIEATCILLVTSTPVLFLSASLVSNIYTAEYQNTIFRSLYVWLDVS